MNYILVFVGGGMGCITRYIFTTIEKNYIITAFPVATLTVNIIACFLMGVVTELIAEKFFSDAEHIRLLLATGFMGGFSTLSALSVETLALIDRHEFLYALLNIFANTAFGLLAAYLGIVLVKHLF